MTLRNALPSLRVLGIIPARGGSKGVPRKNIRPLSGRPLIYYTIAACLKSERLTDFVLTSEDREILDIAQSLGCPVLERPQELALDDTPSLPVIQHALIEQEKQCNDRYDAICLLQPTSPLRTAVDIDRAVKLLEESRSDTVLSVCRTPDEFHPYWAYMHDEAGSLVRSIDVGELPTQRQALPPAYYRNGAIYLVRRKTLLDCGTLYGSEMRSFEMALEVSLNIDTPEDWQAAERLVGQGAQ